mmetsp:Transcript_71959/g.119819  ORF Transcript_71959/g.119819 Transcript_71959/m.119819 type:complete len:413 (+) Transcript_71959:293-1531(+)
MLGLVAYGAFAQLDHSYNANPGRVILEVPSREVDAMNQLNTILAGQWSVKFLEWGRTGADVCSWEGVGCTGAADAEHAAGNMGGIKSIKITAKSGTFPTSFNLAKLFPKLKSFEISGGIRGTLPKDLCGDSRTGPHSELEDFKIERSFDVYGVVPEACWLGEELKEFSIKRTRLAGKIPRRFGEPSQGANMKLQLEAFDVTNSRLTGTLPRSIANFPNLKSMLVDRARLEGGFPEYLPSSLKECSLSPQYTGSKDANAKLRQVQPGSSKYSDTPFDCPVPATLPEVCLATAYCKVVPPPKATTKEKKVTLPTGTLYKACARKDYDFLDEFEAQSEVECESSSCFLPGLGVAVAVAVGMGVLASVFLWYKDKKRKEKNEEEALKETTTGYDMSKLPIPEAKLPPADSNGTDKN